MATTSHYRAKEAEYSELARLAIRPEDARRFSALQRSFRTLANNQQWLVDHRVEVLAPGDQMPTTEDDTNASEGGRRMTDVGGF